MKANKKMDGYSIGLIGLIVIAAVLLLAVGVSASTEKDTTEGTSMAWPGERRVERLVYQGLDQSGVYVLRSVVAPDAIERVMDRFDVCPMGKVSVGNECAVRCVLEADFAVSVWCRGEERPAVMYFSFTDEVVVMTQDGRCYLSATPMMDTEAVRNEFWREEGGWNAGTVD